LLQEAYTIPFNQGLYTQSYVVTTVAKVKLLPLKGLPPQTDIEQLVQLGNKYRCLTNTDQAQSKNVPTHPLTNLIPV
jgi:hypothetical protein